LLPGIAEKHSGDGGRIYTAALRQALALLTNQIRAQSRVP